MGCCDDDRSQGPSVTDNVDDNNNNNGDYNDNNDNGALEGEEDTTTVDPQEQQQENWAAAEGYTPLFDLNNQVHGSSSVMVSMGPGRGGGGEGGSSGDDENDEYGAFFVDASAFMAGEDMDMEEESVEEDVVPSAEAATTRESTATATATGSAGDDFQTIATKALMLLDEEYQRALSGKKTLARWEEPKEEGGATSSNPHDNNSLAAGKESQEKSMMDSEDMKVIAAAFDQRKEETEIAKKEGTFAVDWGCTPAASSKTSSVAAAAATAAKTAVSTDVDTEAVRKAVQALSQKTDTPFQQKFVAWQQTQTSLPATHDIIPPTPYKAFRRSTQKAIQATASLSRSATIAEALVRLREANILLSDSKTAATTLVIDVVGVDHVECESVERIQATFRPIVRWIGAWGGCEFQEVQVRLIGRDLNVTIADPVNLLTPQITATKLTAAIATCHSGVYDEWLQGLPEEESYPNLIIAFNAGIWGYHEWHPTIKYINSRDAAVPMVITAYTLEECQEDMEVVEDAVGGGPRGKLLWESEVNPFGSKVVRETKSSTLEYRENASWQAWSLGCTNKEK